MPIETEKRSATEVIREAVCEAQKEAGKLLARANNQDDINTANRVIKNLEIALVRLRELPIKGSLASFLPGIRCPKPYRKPCLSSRVPAPPCAVVNNRGASGWAQVIHASNCKNPAPAGEQVGRKKPFTFRAGRPIFSPFLDRTVAVRRHEKPAESAAGIIPGNRGKDGVNW